jgi:hypothetical protein
VPFGDHGFAVGRERTDDAVGIGHEEGAAEGEAGVAVLVRGSAVECGCGVFDGG